MFDRCDQADFNLFVGIGRRIWLRRNEVIHGGNFLRPNLIIQQANQMGELVHMFMAKQRDLAPSMGVATTIGWIAPPQNNMKINWDAGIDSK